VTTCSGKEFQIRGAAVGKARLPTVRAPFLRYGDLLAKNCLFSYLSLIRRPRSVCSLWNFALKLTMSKLRWLGYPSVKTAWSYLELFWHDTGLWQTDRQTESIIASTRWVCSHVGLTYYVLFQLFMPVLHREIANLQNSLNILNTLCHISAASIFPVSCWLVIIGFLYSAQCKWRNGENKRTLTLTLFLALNLTLKLTVKALRHLHCAEYG